MVLAILSRTRWCFEANSRPINDPNPITLTAMKERTRKRDKKKINILKYYTNWTEIFATLLFFLKIYISHNKRHTSVIIVFIFHRHSINKCEEKVYLLD